MADTINRLGALYENGLAAMMRAMDAAKRDSKGNPVKNPKIEARVPENIERLIKERAEKNNVTVSDIVRDALTMYFEGNGSLQGPDQGFLAARQLATRIAITAVRQAMDIIPSDFDEAMVWVEEYAESKR